MSMMVTTPKRKRLDINKRPEMPLGENRYYECSYLETWKPCYTGERKITVWYSWDNVLFDYKQAKKAVYLSFCSLLVYLLFTQFTITFIPSSNDIINGAMTELFQLAPRVCFASVSMFLYMVKKQFCIGAKDGRSKEESSW